MSAFDLEVRATVVSRFALDGGAMFGVVPRALWSRAHPPDADNRVALVARVLVVSDRRSGARLLVETGAGQRWSDKERARYAIEGRDDLPTSLTRAGIDPSTITHVLLTHLHWDHAGGLFAGDDPKTRELALPHAEVFVTSAALTRALRAAERDAGSFHRDDLAVLRRGARLRFADETGSPFPFLGFTVAEGHTDGQILPYVAASGSSPFLCFPTDLVPTRAHVRPSWVPAYDLRPEDAIREKRDVYQRLAANDGCVVFYHDPDVEAARVDVEADGTCVAHPATLTSPGEGSSA